MNKVDKVFKIDFLSSHRLYFYFFHFQTFNATNVFFIENQQAKHEIISQFRSKDESKNYKSIIQYSFV